MGGGGGGWGERKFVFSLVANFRRARFNMGCAGTFQTLAIARIVQRLDNVIRRINGYPPDKSLSSG